MDAIPMLFANDVINKGQIRTNNGATLAIR